MTFVLIGLALLTGLAGLGVWGLAVRSREQARATPPLSARPAPAAATAATSPAPTAADTAASPAALADVVLRRAARTEAPLAAAAPQPGQAPPEALASLRWAAPASLSAERQQALVEALRRIPRPPAALQQLMSPQFLARASSGELSDLITGEVRIAVKVLATVNSPFYGLRQPVSSIGQAVTFLGLNSVRSLCLQYLLDDSFKAGNAEQRRIYDQIWAASSLASELCAKLAPRLGLPEPGAWVAQVLLSFLGHLGTASLMLQRKEAGPPPADLLARCAWSQQALGLTPAEIGGLLLREWNLPASIIDDVCAIDRLLVTPADALVSRHSQALAVAYLCARLGERLTAADAPADLIGFDPALQDGVDFFYLRGYLAAPGLARLNDHLQGADIQRCLQALHPPELRPIEA